MQLDPVGTLIFDLVIGGLAAFSLIYMVYYVWSIPRQPRSRLQQIV
jgi:hypothetical protein